MTNIAMDISNRDDFRLTVDGLAREGACRLIVVAFDAEVAQTPIHTFWGISNVCGRRQ